MSEWAVRYKNKGPIVNFINTSTRERAEEVLAKMVGSNGLELDANPSIADIRAYENDQLYEDEDTWPDD